MATPGQFEYRPGDTALDVLKLVSGNAALDNITNVRVSRRIEHGGNTAPIDLDIQAMLNGTANPFALMPGDHLNVELYESSAAAIYGFVRFPGTWPIENAKTTLRELVDMAGGLKPDASLRTAYIERRQSRALKPNADASDLDFFERTYFAKSLGQNRLAIDVEQALKPDAEDIILYDGDTVVFPRDEQTVQVTGNAINPGYIPFVEGQSAQYYIDMAGGEGPNTTGIFVFEAGTGSVHAKLNTVIRPGDTIFINRHTIAETPELQALLISDQVSKRQTRIATTQTIITGITALVGIVNTFLLIRDRLGN